MGYIWEERQKALTPPPMTASQIARTLAASPCVVYFTKRDGTFRRMLTAPTPEGVTVKGTMCRVFDAEKGAWRTVNAATVTVLRPLAARLHREDRAPVARAVARYAYAPGARDDDFDSFGY